jgi:hypothetical protein
VPRPVFKTGLAAIAVAGEFDSLPPPPLKSKGFVALGGRAPESMNRDLGPIGNAGPASDECRWAGAGQFDRKAISSDKSAGEVLGSPLWIRDHDPGTLPAPRMRRCFHEFESDGAYSSRTFSISI